MKEQIQALMQKAKKNAKTINRLIEEVRAEIQKKKKNA